MLRKRTNIARQGSIKSEYEDTYRSRIALALTASYEHVT
jgi:hypothetical protein